MKYKHYFAVMLAFLAIGATSCSKDDPTPQIPPEVGFTSFGFYQEDNAAYLLNDFTVPTVSGTDVTVSVPEELYNDTVAMQSLKARFTTTANDSVFVETSTQQRIAQVSGQSINDFRLPVDYIIKEGQTSRRFTITLVARPSLALLGTYNDTCRDIKMTINPANGSPYFAIQSGKKAMDYGAIVSKWDGSFSTIGSENFASPTPATYGATGRIGSFDLAFTPSGTPYFAYADYTATLSNALSVQKYNGTSWDYVGTRGFSVQKSDYVAMGLAGETPVALYMNNNASSDATRRNLLITTYNASTWSDAIYMPNRPMVNGSIYAAYNSRTVNVGDTIYHGVANIASSSPFSIYKYVGGTWTAVIEGYTEEGAGSPSTYDFRMAVAKNGDIYVGIIYAVNDVSALRIKKYTKATGQWTNVGSAIAGYRYFDIAVSPTGVPYVFYQDGVQDLWIAGLNSSTHDWQQFPRLALKDQVNSSQIQLEINGSGEGYAAYLSAGTKKIQLWGFDTK